LTGTHSQRVSSLFHLFYFESTWCDVAQAVVHVDEYTFSKANAQHKRRDYVTSLYGVAMVSRID